MTPAVSATRRPASKQQTRTSISVSLDQERILVMNSQGRKASKRGKAGILAKIDYSKHVAKEAQGYVDL